MSDGGAMAERRGSWRLDLEEDPQAPLAAVATSSAGGEVPNTNGGGGSSSNAPGAAVAFVPPPRGNRGSVSTASDDGSFGLYSDEEDEALPYPGFLAVTWGCLHQTARPRNYCLAMITNAWFERVSMMVILLNCVTLGMYQPCIDEVCSTNRCKILQMFDDAIFAFFAVEMMIKMVAMGCYGKGTYLAESWNRLDLFIVVAGALEYCLSMEDMNLSAIRTIRVLRPLRAINRIPSMRILVMLLLDTLPMLGNVLLLCFFVFFIFGIVGVQLWAGMLRQRCFIVMPKNVTPIDGITAHYKFNEQEKDYICSLPKDNGMHSCLDLPPYKYQGLICTEEAMPHVSNRPTNDSCVDWNQYYTDCRAGDKNPFQGSISFDNIGLAWVAIFLVISLEGWTDIMYYVQDAHSFWDWIYFVLLIVIGSFFMINLCLVVIATQFSETKKREMERMKLERTRFQSTSTLASGSVSEPNSCYAEIVKYIAHLWRRARRKLYARYRQYRRRHKKSEHPRQLSLKKQRRRRLYEEAHNMFIQQPAPAGQTTGTEIGMVVATPSGPSSSTVAGVGTTAIMNNIGPTPPQHLLLPPEPRDTLEVVDPRNAPRASPEVSDIDPLSSPRRPVLLKIPSGASGDGSATSGNELMPPSPGGPAHNRQRRRSSVMFSDVVLLHGDSGDTATRNVCLSEKTTQTDDEPLDPTLFRELPPALRDAPHQIHQPPSSALVPVKPKSLLRSHAVASRTSSYNGSGGKGSLTCGELLALSGALSAALPTHLGIDSRSVHSLYSSLAKGVKHFSAPTLFFSPDQAPPGFTYSSETDTGDSDSEWSEDDWSEEEHKPPSAMRRVSHKIRVKVRAFVNHEYFQRGILVAILINTLSMGVEYHNQPETLTMVVETSNIIFSAVFALEMMLKVIAEGPFGYISNGFNVFDGIIVVLSVVEMYESYASASSFDLADKQARQGSGGLSVLRTFRLLRILKLVRFMPQLRRQLFVMLRTMDNVAIFFSLLILFIFIFSVLGMFLFGGKFCMKPEDGADCTCQEILDPNSGCICSRMHFNNFLWATVTVFQILTQEDWNVVLFNGMEKTSHWAALYFVALMTFGNYVLFNLLVAILVEGFSAEITGRESRLLPCKLTEFPFEDEKKRSVSSLDDAEDEKQLLKTNEENIKENQLREKLMYTEPKCNIEKENKLLQLPPAHGRDLCAPEINMQVTSPKGLQPSSTVGCPPIITHTAATPQGSPNANLEPSGRSEMNNRLTPTMALYCNTTPTSEAPDRPQGVLRSASIKSNNTVTSVSSRSSRPSSRIGASRPLRRDSLSPHDVSLRRESVSPSPRDRSSSGGGSPLSWRRNSSRRRRGGCAGSRGRGQDRESLVHQDSGSDADAEEETALNNNVTITNNNLNNNNIHVGGDHSHCNGSASAHGNIAPRRSILTQQNSIGSPRTLSPQNSIRSRTSSPRSRQPSMHGQTSVFGSVKELEYKQNNLTLVKEPIAVSTSQQQQQQQQQEDRNEESEDNREQNFKICWYFEPRGCFKERKDYSLYIFPPENKFRQICIGFVSQKWFDSTVLFFIGLNCITLAMERPNIPPHSGERQFLQICNYIFTVVFGVEMFVKVISWGLLYGPKAYFSCGWNIMDGSLVIISIVDILMSFLASASPRIFGILRVFRLLRALRPLRVINRAPGLKLVVQTLLSSLQPIGNIVVICCTFFIIFGILGVQLFKGTFFYCDGQDLQDVDTKEDCLKRQGNHWVNRKYNFDDLGQALMALFVLSSKDGWVNIMYTGLDAVGVDMQPRENYSQWRLLYFISFLLLVGFFVLNMFVGVVVENFHRCREEQEKEEKARRAAKRAKKLEKKRRKMREPPYYSNYSRIRLFIHNIVTSKYFDLAIAAVIGLNVVTMAMEFYKMPKELEYALQIFNYFFTAVFILESAMKMVALGCRRYFKDSEEYRWNQLDVIIVILSVVGIVLEEMKSDLIPINPTIIRVMRVLRIARVLKLLKMAKGIRALLDTVMQALPQVGNLGLLFFLLFFIFAALGVELFGRLECDDDHPCQGLGEHAHFKNFGMAFLTLFRVATGDNWNGIMKDTLRDTCDSSSDCVKNCCLYPFVAPIFFVVFVLMAQFVLVNVVVAVLMKHLEESHKLEEEEAEMAAILRMEDEYDLEVEIERQLAQEEEEMAEMAENLANQKLAQQNKDTNEVPSVQALSSAGSGGKGGGVGGGGLVLAAAHNRYTSQHKTLSKMSSLPANFTFTSSNGSDSTHRDKSTPPPSPGLSDVRVDQTYPIPSININGMGYEVEDGASKQSPFAQRRHYNPNIKRPSPDEPEDKVSVADLSLLPAVFPSPRTIDATVAGTTTTTTTTTTITTTFTTTTTTTAVSSAKLAYTGGVRPRYSPPLSAQQVALHLAKDTSSREGSSQDSSVALAMEDLHKKQTVSPKNSLDNSQGAEAESGFDGKSNRPCTATPPLDRPHKQARWLGRRKSSSGGFRKISLDDSLTQAIMASFDQVPELGGRLDMDSTSCSLCSSDDVSAGSKFSGAALAGGRDLLTRQSASPSGPQNHSSPVPRISLPLALHHSQNEDDDDTLASSTDSFTLEGILVDEPSPSEAQPQEGLPVDPTPNQPSLSSAFTASMEEGAVIPLQGRSCSETECTFEASRLKSESDSNGSDDKSDINSSLSSSASSSSSPFSSPSSSQPSSHPASPIHGPQVAEDEEVVILDDIEVEEYEESDVRRDVAAARAVGMLQQGASRRLS